MPSLTSTIHRQASFSPPYLVLYLQIRDNDRTAHNPQCLTKNGSVLIWILLFSSIAVCFLWPDYHPPFLSRSGGGLASAIAARKVSVVGLVENIPVGQKPVNVEVTPTSPDVSDGRKLGNGEIGVKVFAA